MTNSSERAVTAVKMNLKLTLDLSSDIKIFICGLQLFTSCYVPPNVSNSSDVTNLARECSYPHAGILIGFANLCFNVSEAFCCGVTHLVYNSVESTRLSLKTLETIGYCIFFQKFSLISTVACCSMGETY